VFFCRVRETIDIQERGFGKNKKFFSIFDRGRPDRARGGARGGWGPAATPRGGGRGAVSRWHPNTLSNRSRRLREAKHSFLSSSEGPVNLDPRRTRAFSIAGAQDRGPRHAPTGKLPAGPPKQLGPREQCFVSKFCLSREDRGGNLHLF